MFSRDNVYTSVYPELQNVSEVLNTRNKKCIITLKNHLLNIKKIKPKGIIEKIA
jgi:hypothetical protein